MINPRSLSVDRTYALVYGIPKTVAEGVEATARKKLLVSQTIFANPFLPHRCSRAWSPYISKTKAPAKMEVRNTAFLRKRAL